MYLHVLHLWQDVRVKKVPAINTKQQAAILSLFIGLLNLVIKIV